MAEAVNRHFRHQPVDGVRLAATVLVIYTETRSLKTLAPDLPNAARHALRHDAHDLAVISPADNAVNVMLLEQFCDIEQRLVCRSGDASLHFRIAATFI